MNADRRPGATYQVVLIGLLSLNFGIVFFDRNALSFLMPIVQPELGLSDFEVGLIGSAMALTWAVAGVTIGVTADRVGARKLFLILATIGYSLCSIFSGWAATFALLLAARMLMGAAEGSIAPISQVLTNAAVPEHRRGLAMGAMQTLGAALLGSTVAPLVINNLAQDYGWRNVLYIAGVPGLVTAALLWIVVREPPKPPADAPREKVRLLEVIANRNVLVCTGMAILLVSYMLITWSFMPLILAQDRGLPDQALLLMAVLGVSAASFGLIAPAISDRIGRKPVLIVTPVFGVLLPLAALYAPASPWLIAGAFFVGWALAGTFAMFMATVPAESVPRAHIALAMGFVMGMGELVGGTLGPVLSGLASDTFGRGVFMWILMALCLAAAVMAFGIRESAPAVLARRARGAASPAAAE